MRAAQHAGVLACAALLASCTQPGIAPATAHATTEARSATRPGCYVTTVDPQPVKATITFYGRPDNDPPGRAIAHPVVHRRAGGRGTYCNPTTFATERKNDDRIPYGTKIYVPAIGQYFVREDDCAPSGPRRGHGSNGCYKLWFDLWIGGTRTSKPHDVIRCENVLTPDGKVEVILDPGDGLPVDDPGPIFRNDPPPDGSCLGKPLSS